MKRLKFESVFTNTFWQGFGNEMLTTSETENAGRFIVDNYEAIQLYSTIQYGDAGTLLPRGLSGEYNAHLVFVVVGNAIGRIYDALFAEYDPLQNYYVDRTMQTDNTGSTTKSGSKNKTTNDDTTRTRNSSGTKQPSGSVSTSYTGSKVKSFSDDGDVTQGTTFDDPNTWRNISKNQRSGNETDSYNGYGSTTSYNNYKEDDSRTDSETGNVSGTETETYNNIKDDVTGKENVVEHREGNSGIFSKQELTKKEIDNRIMYRFVPLMVRIIVDEFCDGIWQTGDDE